MNKKTALNLRDVATEPSAAPPTLGGLLRGLRMRNNWTLKEMSDRSGIPLSTLSKVEHDRLTLTYDKLLQLSQKLNIRMSELFAESEQAEEGVTARRSIGRQEDAVRVTTPNYDYYYLCTELRRKRMIPIITVIRAKSLSEFGDLVRHSGEEYIHVLEGEAIGRVDGLRAERGLRRGRGLGPGRLEHALGGDWVCHRPGFSADSAEGKWHGESQAAPSP